MNSPLVGIIMGSDSDLPVMREAKEILDSFGVGNEITIVSAHRTTKRMVQYATTAKKRGITIVIAGAGGASTSSWHGGFTDCSSCNWCSNQD